MMKKIKVLLRHQLIKKTQLVLFLNKILKKKIKREVMKWNMIIMNLKTRIQL